jgi:hypothetical protein
VLNAYLSAKYDLAGPGTQSMREFLYGTSSWNEESHAPIYDQFVTSAYVPGEVISSATTW